LLSLVVAPPARLAAQLPAGIRKGATVEGITEYSLDNGLRVLVFPDASRPTATIGVTILVGSRHEGNGEAGMAHLMEHMQFKGSPKHPNTTQELTDHGARTNGSTSWDRTIYFETVPATDENIAWALDLEADRLVNSFVAKKDLESEFSVVVNELEAGDNQPASVLSARVMGLAYLQHNYGKRIAGTRSDIEGVPIERLQAFYRRYYQPDNAMLVVTGRIEAAKVLKLIAEKFGPIPKPVRTLGRGNDLASTQTTEPAQDGEREVTLRRVGDTQFVLAAYHVPAGAHPDFAALDVLAQVLGANPGGRLARALVDGRKASFAAAFALQLRDPGLLFGQAMVRKEQALEDAKSSLVQAMEAVAREAPSAEEVARAKAAMLRGLEVELGNSELIGLDLGIWQSIGDWRLLFIHRDRLKAVTPDDVRRVAESYLRRDNRTVGLFVPTERPERVEIPTVSEAAVMALTAGYRGNVAVAAAGALNAMAQLGATEPGRVSAAGISDAELAAATKDYKGNAALAAGEEFDASSANIDRRTARSVLPNGMKLALLPKLTRGNTVTALVTLRFGDAQSLAGRALAAQLVSAMLDKGSRRKTRQQIRDEFDKLRSQVSFGGASNNVTALIRTTRVSLLPTLRLVAEILKEPAFDAGEFEKLRQERLAGIESQQSDPGVRASNLLSRGLSPYPKGSPLRVATIEELIAEYKALKVDDVRGVYDALVGASAGDVAMVGDFPKDSVTALARELFGSWKSPRPFARLVRTFFDVPQFNERIETPDKANAIFFAGQNLRLRDDGNDYAALTLGNYLLGGGFLNSRLTVRLRQTEGMSYNVNSGLSAQALDSVGALQVNAFFNPENVVRFESAFGEEIGRVLKDGFGADEVEKGKQGWLQLQGQNRALDSYLVGLFASQALTGRTMEYNQDLEKLVAALTPAEVNAAMKKYISLAKLSTVKAGDFQNHPPKVPAIKP
jgi:zinc protease